MVAAATKSFYRIFLSTFQTSSCVAILGQAALKAGAPLALVVAETVRLRAPGIDVRMTTSDTVLPASASSAPVPLPKVGPMSDFAPA
jgi:hypothetical protein